MRSPFLCTGVTSAFFRFTGKVAVSIDLLKSESNLLDMISLYVFIMFGGIEPLGHALDSLSRNISV